VVLHGVLLAIPEVAVDEGASERFLVGMEAEVFIDDASLVGDFEATLLLAHKEGMLGGHEGVYQLDDLILHGGGDVALPDVELLPQDVCDAIFDQDG